MPHVHAVPAPDGGWSVEVEQGDRAMRHAETKEEAERIAEELKSWPEGGEVVIHNPDGGISDTDTIGNADEGPDIDKVH